MGGGAENESNRVEKVPEVSPVPTAENTMPELTVDQITENTPRARLKESTASDPSLCTIRRLADTEKERYQWDDGLVFRHRLNECGESYKQLCLPQEFRTQCVTLAHEKFGHRGRNKVI